MSEDHLLIGKINYMMYLAMLQKLNIPTWFLTLSAADLHWPEMIQAVAVQFGKKLTQKDVQKMSIKDRSTYLCQIP